MLFRLISTALHAVFRLIFTLEYFGEENVPETGAVIVAGNHPSYLDPLLITLPIDRRIFFMAWDKLFSIPVLGTLMRQAGAFPVRLGTKDPNAYQKALDVLSDGKALGIFPEAGRTAEGPMNPLKTGTARLAIESGAPIVPVTITGAYDAWPSSRLVPWPRKITVKYHTPIVLDPDEVLRRGDDRVYHEEVMLEVREAIERRLIPSLSADARKRRVFEGPASLVRIYELYPVLATIFGLALGGPARTLILLGALHLAYVFADIWWIPQGRLAKALREIVTPFVGLAYGPALAMTVGLVVPEWWTLAAIGAGAGLSFNWSNQYKAERYVRGAMLAYLVSFIVAIGHPHPFGPHLAFASFTLVYAVFWRPLFWHITAVVMATYCGVVLMVPGITMAGAAAWYLLLSCVVGVYIRIIKFSAHDGRII